MFNSDIRTIYLQPGIILYIYVYIYIYIYIYVFPYFHTLSDLESTSPQQLSFQKSFTQDFIIPVT